MKTAHVAVFFLYLSMRILIFALGLFSFSFSSFAQSHTQKIIQHRTQYKQDFLTDKNSPLTQRDLKGLRFYNPDSTYRVKAQFESITDTLGFDMQTHNGVLKRYYIYGKVEFSLFQNHCTLYIYQSQQLKQKPGLEDYLFIPFTDQTNYKETFGGGRYMDFKIGDIQHDKLEIDFNTCYNPYCAYKEGYSCPIPPIENKLNIRIVAGEKTFNPKAKKSN